jgi:hypothetical protein
MIMLRATMVSAIGRIARIPVINKDLIWTPIFAIVEKMVFLMIDTYAIKMMIFCLLYHSMVP